MYVIALDPVSSLFSLKYDSNLAQLYVYTRPLLVVLMIDCQMLLIGYKR